MTLRTPLACLLAGALAFAACDTPNRTDNLAPVQHDEDQYPGNDNVLEDNRLRTEEPPVVGSVNSYAGSDEEESYSNLFRRSPEDADFAVVTETDLDMPHTSVSDGEPIATADPSGDYDVEDRVRENLEYGSNRASELDDDGDDPDAREVRGGNQDAIGARGYANHELREYYDTDEENYGYDDDDGDATGNSWIRVLDPAEKNYNEQVVKVGGVSTDSDYRTRYEELKDVMYAVPENQQARLYAPNNYSFDFVTSWSGVVKSAQSDDADADYGNEVAYDRPPLMGTGCEQSDDPISCSTAELDGQLKDFLNDPRVLASMRRSGIEGVDFEVNEKGEIVAGSVRAKAAGKRCVGDDCERFNRSLERALRKQSWQPAQRRGRNTVSRVKLPLRYQQTEEQVDLG